MNSVWILFKQSLIITKSVNKTTAAASSNIGDTDDMLPLLGTVEPAYNGLGYNEFSHITKEFRRPSYFVISGLRCITIVCLYIVYKRSRFQLVETTLNNSTT